MMIYNYIFYKMFVTVSRTNKSIPGWSTMITLSVILFFNIITVINIFFKEYIYLFANQNISVGLGILLMIVNYLIFIRKNAYDKIINQYKKETKKQSYVRGSLVLFYIVGSVYLFFETLP